MPREDHDHDLRKGRPAPDTVNASAPDLWGWPEKSVAAGDVLTPGDDARDHVVHFVRLDRDGLMTRRLLIFTTDRRAPIRRTIFELLDQLHVRGSGWPLVADAAETALSDPDPSVRRTAATLLVHTAGPGRALAALDTLTDPAVRIALVNAIPWHRHPRHQATVERLRSDTVPAIRLLANCAAPGVDDTVIRADLDAAVADLTALGKASAGELWAHALTGSDRDEACYTRVRRLTGSAETPEVRLEGVRMAAIAIRFWRAAPVRLTPALTALLRENPSPVRSAALRTLTASMTASRLAAEDLAALLDDPELGAPAAVALGGIGDHRAMPHLVQQMLAGGTQPGLLAAFRTLARAGADPADPVAAARHLLATTPDSDAPELPMRVLAAFGPAAAPALPELLAKLTGAVNDTPDLTWHVLGRIGPAAVAAVPHLRDHGALFALVQMTSDRAPVDQHLAGLPEALRRGRLAAVLLTWLADHGGLTVRQHRQLRSLFGTPGPASVDVAAALWRHEGPAAAADLLAVLSEHLADDLLGPKVLEVFAAMGPHARPILGRLDEFITRRHRAGFNVGGPDAELHADETLLAAMLAARERIAG
ncbi:hypothetical protein Apa02nite_063000 [Actinoplanes palleronii]|uniref:HEAT repeat protein n=1 Tax=Actinoplanes palleronii TaxID=113570 RepID=A0ABQ4BHN2_9ACTN|nr:hypothetical protein Apa02nite_063000 [Actinoplanes palleronii]